MLDQGVVSGTRLGTTLVLTRCLDKESFGLYFLAFSTMLLVQSTFQHSLLLVPLCTLAGQKEGEDRQAYLRSSAGVSALAALLVTGITLVAVEVYRGLGGAPLSCRVFQLMALANAAFFLHEYGRRVLFTLARARQVLGIDLVWASLQLGGLLALAWPALRATGPGPTPASAFGVLVASTLGAGLLGAWWVREEHRGPGPWWRRVDLEETWDLGRWWTLAGGAWALSAAIFPYALAGMQGLADVGSLAACTTIQRLVNPFVQALGNVFMPATARAYARDGARELRRVSRQFLALVVLGIGGLTGVLATFGTPIMTLLFGPEYADAGLLATLLVGASLLSHAGLPAMVTLGALRDPFPIVRANLAGTLVAALVAYPALRALGIYGVPLGTGLTYGITLVMLIASSRMALDRAEARDPSPDAPSEPAPDPGSPVSGAPSHAPRGDDS